MSLVAHVDKVTFSAASVVGTTDSTGTTGSGFRPKAMIAWWNGAAGAGTVTTQGNIRRGVGFAKDASNRRCVMATEQDTAAQGEADRGVRDDCLIGVILPGTSDPSTLEGKVDINAMLDTGWESIIDDQLAVDLTVRYMAIGGDDIEQVAVGDFAAPLTAIDTVVSLGWMPDVVFLASVGGAVAMNGIGVDSVLGFGVATGTDADRQWTHCSWSDDGPATIDTWKYMRSGECIAMANGATAINFRGVLASFDDDGFTINWPEVDGANQPPVIYLAMKGGRWKAGNFLTTTTLNEQIPVVSGNGKPKLLLAVSAGMAESAVDTPAATDEWSMGGAINPLTRQDAYSRSVDNLAAAECRRATGEISFMKNFVNTTGQTTDERVDLAAINYDGFTAAMDLAGSGANFIGYVVAAADSDTVPAGKFDGEGRIYRGDPLRYYDAGNLENVGFLLSPGNATIGDTISLMLVEKSGTTLVLTTVNSIPHGSQAGAPPYWRTTQGE